MSYCDWPEFYSDSKPRARKPHRCVECRAPIEKGELHYAYSGKWDGDFSSGRQHLLCLNLCVFIRDKFQSGECLSFGGLHEGWDEINWDRRFREFDEKDKEARSMMAQIKWRERKHRTRHRRINGVYVKRKWGESKWVARGT